MSTLLRIDSSSRVQGSHSRELADFVQTQWLTSQADGKVIVRDLVASPIPHILDTTIAGYYTPADQHTPELKAAVALSDELIAELLSADTLLFSIPVYNFGIPSALKAYIDHTVRIGQTFGYDEKTGLFGLVEGKKAFVAASYGATGYFGGQLASYNFLEPYMRTLLSFLGIKDITFFSVEGTSTDPASLASTREQAHADILRAVAA